MKKIKKAIIAGLCGLCASLALQAADIPRRAVYPVRDAMEIKSLNGVWKFRLVPEGKIPASETDFFRPEFNDGAWDHIRVPANWEMEGKKEPEYGGDIRDCLGLYRTTFRLNSAWQSKHVILRFDGVLFAYDVYVNGHHVGYWASSFNMCQFDITPFIYFDGPNVLAVKVSTRAKGYRFDLNDDWALSGIFRDVELFSVPDTHLKDVTFKSFLKDDHKAMISVDVSVDAFTGPPGELYVQAMLNDESGKTVCAFRNKMNREGEALTHFEGLIEQPTLWTAETPYLYRLEVYLTDVKNNVVQHITEKVGIREVSVKDGILLINNKPVHIRGVCMNEMHPTLGRAWTDEVRIHDLKMLKAANANFVRTAHYPFHPRFLEICDELGLYVCNEVPFGYGDMHLTDPAYQDELYKRAEATIARDKNHPSVIVWSVGNENPYTELVENTVQYVKEKDPTRPRVLPMVGTYFMENRERLSDNVSMYSFHYQSPEAVERIAKLNEKPILLTEYSHSLGLSFDALEAQYAMMKKYKNIAGGSVWDWADQAILKTRSKQEFLNDTLVQGVWKDSTQYYDSFNDRGSDGIVYANRYPQEDYRQVRKVYSPVVFTDSLIHAATGNQEIRLTIENRFDFISLCGYQCRWALKNFRQILSFGVIDLNTPAQSQSEVKLTVNVPDSVAYRDYVLVLTVYDKQMHAVCERSLPLLVNAEPLNYPVLLNREFAGKTWKVEKGKTIRAATDDLRFSLDHNGKIRLTGKGGKVYLDSELLIRVGRKPTINLLNLGMRRKDLFYWNPYLLPPEIVGKNVYQTKDTLHIALDCRWNRQEKQGEYIDGKINIAVSRNSVIHFDYSVKPQQATGSLLEFGLALCLPFDVTTFRWLGDGPFSSTPGKRALNEKDVWTLDKDDIRFTGNRANVDVALFTGDDNYAIGFAGNRSDLGVENIDGRIVISDNLVVVGYGTKLSQPINEQKADKIGEKRGAFCLTIVNTIQNKGLFHAVFSPYDIVLPEKPFLKSYGF
ncbi:MAG: DUF4981 domain-containing protein [Candidatus Azobacteroides sp.]|nr:DUF4981 domain-containing protein [Candidatus Azobacteroides sp.]